LPLITAAFIAHAAGLLIGFGGASLVGIIASGTLAAVAAVRRDMYLGALALLAVAGVLRAKTALDADMKIVPGGIVAQFRQAFGNVLTTLAEAGGRPEDLVSITIYLTDIPDYQAHGREIGQVWRELAGATYPAMAGIGTTALWQPEALIEIVGVAVIPDERLTPPRT